MIDWTPSLEVGAGTESSNFNHKVGSPGNQLHLPPPPTPFLGAFQKFLH